MIYYTKNFPKAEASHDVSILLSREGVEKMWIPGDFFEEGKSMTEPIAYRDVQGWEFDANEEERQRLVILLYQS